MYAACSYQGCLCKASAENRTRHQTGYELSGLRAAMGMRTAWRLREGAECKILSITTRLHLPPGGLILRTYEYSITRYRCISGDFLSSGICAVYSTNTFDYHAMDATDPSANRRLLYLSVCQSPAANERSLQRHRQLIPCRHETSRTIWCRLSIRELNTESATIRQDSQAHNSIDSIPRQANGARQATSWRMQCRRCDPST